MTTDVRDLSERGRTEEQVEQDEVQRAVEARRALEVKYTPVGETAEITVSYQHVRNLLTKPTRSGRTPSKADIIKFMMLCKTRGFNPFTGDVIMVGYDVKVNGRIVDANFEMIITHQAMIRRADSHPDYRGKESGVVVAKDDGTVSDVVGEIVIPGWTLIGGWCEIEREGRKKRAVSG